MVYRAFLFRFTYPFFYPLYPASPPPLPEKNGTCAPMDDDVLGDLGLAQEVRRGHLCLRNLRVGIS